MPEDLSRFLTTSEDFSIVKTPVKKALLCSFDRNLERFLRPQEERLVLLSVAHFLWQPIGSSESVAQERHPWAKTRPSVSSLQRSSSIIPVEFATELFCSLSPSAQMKKANRQTSRQIRYAKKYRRSRETEQLPANHRKGQSTQKSRYGDFGFLRQLPNNSLKHILLLAMQNWCPEPSLYLRPKVLRHAHHSPGKGASMFLVVTGPPIQGGGRRSVRTNTHAGTRRLLQQKRRPH